MIKEFFTYFGIQGSIWIATIAFSTGAGIYTVQHPTHDPYKPDMTRATTYTGKGQFRCQIGC